MSSTEDTELRDVLVQELESNGTLGKIRAQLRASVFLALEQHTASKLGVGPGAKALLNCPEGLLAVNLVLELLNAANCLSTASVFQQEMGVTDVPDRRELERRLGISHDDSGNEGDCVLVSLLKQWGRGSRMSAGGEVGERKISGTGEGGGFSFHSDAEVSSSRFPAPPGAFTVDSGGKSNKDSGSVANKENEAMYSTPTKDQGFGVAKRKPVRSDPVDSLDEKSDSSEHTSSKSRNRPVEKVPLGAPGGASSTGSMLGDLPSLGTVTGKAGTLQPLATSVFTGEQLSTLVNSMDIVDGSSSSDSFSLNGKKASSTAATSKGTAAEAATSKGAASSAVASKGTAVKPLSPRENESNPRKMEKSGGLFSSTTTKEKKSSEEEESEIIEDISVGNDLLKSEASNSSKISF